MRLMFFKALGRRLATLPMNIHPTAFVSGFVNGALGQSL
jgi:hypothetical protein